MSKNFELLQRVAKDNFFELPEETVLPPKKPLPAMFLKKSPADPEITKLVQRLFSQAGEGGRSKVVSFSGMEHDDRSSWICARAGEVLADRAERSVCLVDANFSTPQLHLHLGAANQNGLAEAITTKGTICNFVTQVSGENLSMIPAGLVKPGFHPSTERYRERFAELREEFDYVLISAPSFSHETEATFIGLLADGLVLIVEANQTRRETLRHTTEQLESAKVRLLGAVLDQRTFPIPEFLYRRL